MREAGSFAGVKKTLLAAALLVTSVFSATGCGSDDGEAPVESRIRNSNCIDDHTQGHRVRADESFKADAKSWCSTPLEESFDSDDDIDDDSYYDSKPEKNLEKIFLYYDPSHDDDIKDKISINLNIDDERLAHLLDLDDDEDNDDTTPPSYIYLGEDDRDIEMYAPASDDDVDLLDIDEG
jgi:hypothetical protein